MTGSSLLALLACTDSALVVHNDAPLVSITSPPDGAVLAEGSAAIVTASVNDDRTEPADLALSWSLEDGSSPEGTVELDGTDLTITLAAPFPVGAHTFTLEAVDGKSDSGSDAVDFEVIAGDAPVVSFDAPSGDVLAGDLVLVSVTITDADEADLSALTLTWAGTAAGADTGPTHTDSSGHAELYLPGQDAGAWTLSLTAADPAGHTGSGLTSFTAVEGDTDGDGHVDEAWGGDDCDDADASVYPGAPEHCDGADEDCDGAADNDPVDPTTWILDADGDGYGDATVEACEDPGGTTSVAGDCDDTDAAIFPGAPEHCDGADEDCDSTIDNDPVDPASWYLDVDADGFGGASTLACTDPGGTTTIGGDCDDAEDRVYPGAIEHCDGVDEDCDGVIDNNTVDGTTWLTDEDGDGYGGGTVVACEDPGGTTTVAGDCDDADDTIFPGAPEHCDGVDEDCDGTIDNDPVDPATWLTDLDGDGFGSGSVAACEDPGGTAATGGDCDDGDAAVNPAAPEVCDSRDNDCDRSIDEGVLLTWYRDADDDGHGAGATTTACTEPSGYAGTDDDCDDTDPRYTTRCPAPIESLSTAHARILGDSPGDTVGTAVAAPGDVDGDGLADLVVAAPGAGNGAVGVFRGSLAGDVAFGSAATIWTGAAADDEAGTAVAGDADLTGDGVIDLVIAARHVDTAGTDDGAVYVVSATTPGTTSLASATILRHGALAAEATGADVDVGDLTGDGQADLVIGSDYWGSGGASHPGAAIVVPGPISGAMSETTGAWLLSGETAADAAGMSVDAHGDFDGDGIRDLLVGAPLRDRGATDAGGVYVVYGPITASASLSTADAYLNATATSTLAGTCVAAAGDVDGDGNDDLVIGGSSYDHTTTNDGAAWIVYGAPTGFSTFSTADASVYGETAYHEVGCDVASAGDLDADGFADVLIGACGDNTAVTDGGAVYVAYGPIGGTVALADIAWRLTGPVTADVVGLGLAGLGDTSGDGVPDLLLGALGDPTNGSYAGAAYVVLGY